MKMFLAGKWVDRDRKIKVRNPFDGSVIDDVPWADGDDVDKAVESALAGFEQMKKLTRRKRASILEKTACLIDKKQEELGITIAKESGKTIREGKGEAGRAIETFTLSADEARRLAGEIIPFDAAPGAENKFGFYLRRPIGVVGAISPFNFPLNLVAHKIAPAIAAGNSIVLKPASATPLVALKLTEILLEAGLPPLAINVICGPGEEVGEKLAADCRLRLITFTGSLEVGKRITAVAGIKRVTLELGSNSALIVMGDADLKRASTRAAACAFALAGQVCISLQRIFVEECVFDEFTSLLVKKTGQMRTGNQLLETTDVGPMIDEKAAENTQILVDEAVGLGAKLLTGGKRSGSLYLPSVLVSVPDDTRFFKEEAFAPLVLVNPVKSLVEAIRETNKSVYGLQAGIFTKDISAAMQAAHEIDAGGVMINEAPTFRADLQPYGGMKQSGIGREGPKFAIEEMTELKAVAFHL